MKTLALNGPLLLASRAIIGISGAASRAGGFGGGESAVGVLTRLHGKVRSGEQIPAGVANRPHSQLPPKSRLKDHNSLEALTIFTCNELVDEPIKIFTL